MLKRGRLALPVDIDPASGSEPISVAETDRQVSFTSPPMLLPRDEARDDHSRPLGVSEPTGTDEHPPSRQGRESLPLYLPVIMGGIKLRTLNHDAWFGNTSL